MKISVNWLADYVTLPAHGDALAQLPHRLTMAGLEVEGSTSPGEALRGVVVAQIRESVKHPNADKLSVTQIDIGGPSLLTVVCGAKNYQVGDRVPLATIGTRLPNGTEIKQSTLRGVESFGMLCSARELGLSEEASGLLILEPAGNFKLGEPIAKALGIDDTVLELNVTPNRPDALSHLGVAREVAALYRVPLRLPVPRLGAEKLRAADAVKIRIEDPIRCPRYTARVVEGVTVGPSPQWMSDRLRACGVRAINNVVDVTNYVLLEMGQPLHGFDLDKLAGGEIVVRCARLGEKLTTLDGKDRTLDPEDLLICDGQQPQVLAGVMGGASSEVTAVTRRVLLEAAYFQPSTVRRSAKRHALHTESSHRFERGGDIEVLPAALDRAAALIAELGGGQVREGRVDVYPSPVKARGVVLRYEKVGELLGAAVPAVESKSILESLGFVRESETKAESSRGIEARFRVPTARVDVEREVDLIEEVARIRGYEAIPETLPRSSGELAVEPREVEVERRLRHALAGAGFDEVINYSFVSPRELELFGQPGAITLVNPLSAEQSVMRTTLYAGLLQNVSRNLRHQAPSLRLYELGRVYQPDAGGGVGERPAAVERPMLAGVLCGLRESRSWTGAASGAAKDAPVDFFDAKGAVEALLDAIGVESATFEPIQRTQVQYHPRAAALVKVGDCQIGTLGELHPGLARRLDVPAGLFLFELDVAALVTAARLVPSFQALARFPAVLRDIAMVVPAELPHEEIQKLLREVGAPLVVEVNLFDIYTGKPIPEGKKSVAYALTYRATDRTLTDAEVGEAHQKIVSEANQRLGGNLRGANT